MHNVKGAWRMCVGAALLQFTIVGICSNSFSVYLPYLQQRCGLSNTLSSNIILIRNLVAFASLFFVEKFYRKTELRWGIVLSLLLTAASSAVFAMAENFQVLMIATTLWGLGYGLGGMYPVSVLLHRWFSYHESIALGICSGCTGVALIVGSPIITALCEAWGVQVSMTCQAVLMALSSIVCFALIKNYPPEGQLAQPTKKTKAKRKFRMTWMHVAAMGTGVIGNTTFQFIALHFKTMGFAPFQVAMIVSSVGISLMASKLIFGGVVDYFGTYRANWIFMPVTIGGLILSCLCGTSYPLALISMIGYGLGLAFATIGMTVYAEDLYSIEEFEALLREYQIFTMLGALLTSPLPGILADAAGTYIPFYAFSAAVGVFTLVIIQRNYFISKKRVGR